MLVILEGSLIKLLANGPQASLIYVLALPWLIIWFPSSSVVFFPCPSTSVIIPHRASQWQTLGPLTPDCSVNNVQALTFQNNELVLLGVLAKQAIAISAEQLKDVSPLENNSMLSKESATAFMILCSLYTKIEFRWPFSLSFLPVAFLIILIIEQVIRRIITEHLLHMIEFLKEMDNI